MRIFTTTGRWLFLLLAFACFASTAYAQRNVTLRVNAASIPDTLNANSVMEARGSFNGWSGGVNALTHVGGDMWEATIDMSADEQLFKFWSGNADALGLNTGWESDLTTGGNRVIAAGSDPVTVGGFFNATGGSVDPDWTPYEKKDGMVAVWYRVYMNTEDAATKGYDRDNPDEIVAVRGDPMNGDSQLTWGDDTGVVLTREVAGNDAVPGYDLWSGVGYYPASAVGNEQAYKFVVGAAGWENDINGGNRTFTVPASDTTLAWKLFSGSPALTGGGPVEGTTIFSVDLTPLQQIGIFDKARGDTLEVRGDFNGWSCANPDNCLLFPFPGTNIFEAEIPLKLIPETVMNYKFFINFNDENFRAAFGIDPPSGWEEPISTTGANRQFVYDGTTGQFLGDKFFNDIQANNIIVGDPVDVTWSVDMTTALSTNALTPFDAASDSVFVSLEDPLWNFTQGIPRPEGDPQFDGQNFLLADQDGDMVYTGTLTLATPTYSGIQYRYTYGQPSTGAMNAEQGGGFSDAGRRRTRFVELTANGRWPASWSFPQESFQEEGNLPFDTNPEAVAIEQIGKELPQQVTLEDNYPNPFNPTTTFTYSLNQTSEVSLKVYDLLGRVVATLVDGVQQAAQYQVTFDAADLASGVYLYRLETPGHVITKQMVLVK